MSDSDNEKNDLEFTRQTYYDLIQKGQESLDEMMNIASALEHPRAFEVVAGLIKNVSEVNDKLIEMTYVIPCTFVVDRISDGLGSSSSDSKNCRTLITNH